MTAPTQLSLYNGALRKLGERKLASLSENTKGRRLLDDVYADALDFCLEQGHWRFAQRVVKLTADPSYTSTFGYRYQFAIPDDLVRMSKIANDEFFEFPLLRYEDTAGFWFADIDEIYVSYVSNDSSYGADKSLWPRTYTEFVEFYLASEIVEDLCQSEKKTEKIIKLLEDAELNAKSKDAMRDPPRFAPTGQWVSARHGPRNVTRKNRRSLLG